MRNCLECLDAPSLHQHLAYLKHTYTHTQHTHTHTHTHTHSGSSIKPSRISNILSSHPFAPNLIGSLNSLLDIGAVRPELAQPLASYLGRFLLVVEPVFGHICRHLQTEIKPAGIRTRKHTEHLPPPLLFLLTPPHSLYEPHAQAARNDLSPVTRLSATTK